VVEKLHNTFLSCCICERDKKRLFEVNARIAKGGSMNENILFVSEHRNELFGSFCAEQKERLI
jgi:hypothetical protein